MYTCIRDGDTLLTQSSTADVQIWPEDQPDWLKVIDALLLNCP
jgi:hypothetical protein